MSTSIYDNVLAERWHRYLPPARPSAGDLEIYDLAMREPKRSLLLGSTPELRSLAGRHGHTLTVAEGDRNVFKTLRSMMTHDADEECICCNWLELSSPKRFELAIADGSINMLPPDTHERFIERMAKHLDPEGLFLCHCHMVSEPEFETEAEIFGWARTQDEHIYTATRQHLCMLWLNRDNGEINNEDCWRRFQELHRAGVVRASELQEFERLFEHDKISVYFITRKRFSELVSPYFEIEAARCAGDYTFHEEKPIYFLRRKP
jgi:hypothetical protein